jgi:hypothetical protein
MGKKLKEVRLVQVSLDMLRLFPPSSFIQLQKLVILNCRTHENAPFSVALIKHLLMFSGKLKELEAVVETMWDASDLKDLI